MKNKFYSFEYSGGIVNFFDERDIVSSEHFSYEGNSYIVGYYKGTKQPPLAISEQQYLNSVDKKLITVSIETVSNTLPDFDDKDTTYTVVEGTDVTVTGTLQIPDQNFRVPFNRVDTNRIQLMTASVKDGIFTLNLNFKTSGKWVVNSELLNSELDQPVFQIEPQTFYVVV